MALEEDIRTGDVTTNALVPPGHRSCGVWTARQEGVVAGLFVGEAVFQALDPQMEWTPRVAEGERVQEGDILVEMEGRSRALLSGERTALNFVQRMAGIATAAATYSRLLAQTPVKILDTRKTVPGQRALDKYAVKAGGGTNHRHGLYDLAMIKENHIAAAGGLRPAVEGVRQYSPELKVEVETTSLEEVNEALESGADIIMLDNMSSERMREAVAMIGGRAQVEASGNITRQRLQEVAATGVDFISAGALTHSVTAFDISQRIEI